MPKGAVDVSNLLANFAIHRTIATATAFYLSPALDDVWQHVAFLRETASCAGYC
jgi:hypothetical protein